VIHRHAGTAPAFKEPHFACKPLKASRPSCVLETGCLHVEDGNPDGWRNRISEPVATATMASSPTAKDWT
jgi:hypothetical protein